MRTFTLNTTGDILPGIKFRKTMHNCHGIPVGVTEDNKANELLIVTPSLAEASQGEIIDNCSVITDGVSVYLGLEASTDKDDVLLLLHYMRGQAPVTYGIQRFEGQWIELAKTACAEDSPIIMFGFSNLPEDDLGLEAVVRLSEGDMITCKTANNVPIVLEWTGNKLSRRLIVPKGTVPKPIAASGFKPGQAQVYA